MREEGGKQAKHVQTTSGGRQRTKQERLPGENHFKAHNAGKKGGLGAIEPAEIRGRRD